MSLPMSGFWELYHASYGPTMPDLTALIRVLYCIMPSSVPCERIFSHVKLVWSHLRCQLQPVQVETLTRCWAYANAGMWSVNDSVTRFFASAGRGPRRPGAKDAERKPRSDKKPTVSAQEALECQPDVPLVPPTPSRKRKGADSSDEPRALLQSTLTFGTPVSAPPVDDSVEAPRFAPLSKALETSINLQDTWQQPPAEPRSCSGSALRRRGRRGSLERVLLRVRVTPLLLRQCPATPRPSWITGEGFISGQG